MTVYTMPPNDRSSKRRRRQRGQELIEFSLVLVPMLALIFIFMDIAWGVYIKATMEHAVRVGCRYAITNAIPDPYLPDLCSGMTSITACVGDHVIFAAGGVLDDAVVVPQGGTCSSETCIVVQYFSPTGAPAAGQLNQGGNIVEVTVTGYRKGSDGNDTLGTPMSTLITPFLANSSKWYTTASSADTMSGVLVYKNP